MLAATPDSYTTSQKPRLCSSLCLVQFQVLDSRTWAQSRAGINRLTAFAANAGASISLGSKL